MATTNEYTFDTFTSEDLESELRVAEEVESRFEYEFEDGTIYVQTYAEDGEFARRYRLDVTIVEVAK